MNPDVTESRSRRALLAGIAGGLGAWAATSLGRVTPVLADGETMVVGGEYENATSKTMLFNDVNDELVFVAISQGGGTGVVGASVSASGVDGHSDSASGVFGRSGSGAGIEGFGSTGVLGTCSPSIGTGVVGRNTGAGAFGGYGVEGTNVLGDGVHGVSEGGGTGLVGDGKWGVLGRTGDDGGAGLWGQHFGTGSAVFGHSVTGSGRGVLGIAGAGHGVRGEATSGAALFGTATSGYALRTSGRLRADKVSGVATIRAGATSITVSPGVDVTSGSFVLLTSKANIGSRALWFTTDATNNRFTIRLSSSRTSATQVAWLLLG